MAENRTWLPVATAVRPKSVHKWSEIGRSGAASSWDNNGLDVERFLLSGTAMTQPRLIVEHHIHLITRRCAQRMCLLRPDDETNQIFGYCLANAARKTGVVVLASLMMSNHHHTVVYDPDRRVSEFCHELHTMVARAMNLLRGRSENFWAREEPSIVRLADRYAVIEKMAYVANNPVKAQLVEATEHWPGVNTVGAFLRGGSLVFKRPAIFFRRDGDLPDEISLVMGWPEILGDVERARRELRKRVDDLASLARQQRVSEGRVVAGRAAVRKQDFGARPRTVEARRQLRPRVSAGDGAVRAAALLVYRMFLAAYRDARRLWLRGESAIFPPGTYLLGRVPGVVVAKSWT